MDHQHRLRELVLHVVVLCFLGDFFFGNVVAKGNFTVPVPEIVVVKSHINVKFFEVPTSDDPVLIWVEVQKGIFPYTKIMESNNVSVGDPLTIYVYLRDKTGMYDAKVSRCWAADHKNLNYAKTKLLLTDSLYRKGRYIGEWQKYPLPDGEEIRSFLYKTIKAFKFPENSQIYITCDVELCFQKCSNGYKLSNLL